MWKAVVVPRIADSTALCSQGCYHEWEHKVVHHSEAPAGSPVSVMRHSAQLSSNGSIPGAWWAAERSNGGLWERKRRKD